MTEVARWANATAAGSDSITNITHTARADRIKTIIGTIPMITEGEKALNLAPITSANASASLPATRTRGQFVIREYFLPHGLKASKKHAVNFWLRIATVIGLMIAAVLIWLFNRWLTRRRLLARQHASAEAETRATDWPSGIFPTSGGEIGLGISFGGEPPCLNNLRQKRY